MNIAVLVQFKTKNHVVKIICEKPNTSLLCIEIYSKSCQTSKMGIFVKILVEAF